MLVIGLTGGIGSGKSSVARLFSALGAAVIDTDEIAHRLTEKDTPVFAAILDQFGPGYQLPDGNLDRAQLRKRIFSDQAAKSKLEALLHPLIKQQVVSKMNDAQGPYLILVIPLFFETGTYHDLVDRILVVDCAESQQISRTMFRSKFSIEEVRAIMSQQSSRTERLQQADDILVNQSTHENLEKHARELHQHYLTLALQKPE